MARKPHSTHIDPAIGAERWLVEHIDHEIAKGIARSRGWNGDDDTLLDHCDVGAAAATYTEHKTLDEACAQARANLATGRSMFGACLIDHQVFERNHDDRGRNVSGGSWEDQTQYEIAADGECVQVS